MGVVMNRSAINKIMLAAFCLTPCLVATSLSPVAAKAEAVKAPAKVVKNSPVVQESACDLVAPGGDLGVRPDGSVYLKSSNPFRGDADPCLPEVIMTDRGGQATLQTIAGRPGPRATSIGYVKPDVLQQYKQINKELPGVHSARTGLAGLSRNWQ